MNYKRIYSISLDGLDLKRLIFDGCFYGVHDFQKIVNLCCFIAEQWKKR